MRPSLHPRHHPPASLLLALALALAVPAAAQPLSDARVRDFLADQQAAWNDRRFEAYFAGFTPDAVFVEQTRTPKETISYGRSTVAQARAQARRSGSAGRSKEASIVRSIAISPDGARARVLGDKVTTVEGAGGARRYCATTDQTLVLVGGRLRSTGQIDTLVRCPRPR